MSLQDSNHKDSWGTQATVSFFMNNRNTSSQVYKSEWLFLKDLIRENMSVLDIGCALGGFSEIIGERISRFSYTGVDISENMINIARNIKPQHEFYHISEADLSILNHRKFDLVLCLGILHLSWKWRELLIEAWKLTGKNFLYDLRVTSEETVEDIKKSYFSMDFAENISLNISAKSILPYIIINSSEALKIAETSFFDASSISQFGYTNKPHISATTLYDKVLMNTWLITKVSTD